MKGFKYLLTCYAWREGSGVDRVVSKMYFKTRREMRELAEILEMFYRETKETKL